MYRVISDLAFHLCDFEPWAPCPQSTMLARALRETARIDRIDWSRKGDAIRQQIAADVVYGVRCFEQRSEFQHAME